MATKEEVPMMQLATRIPKDLHKRIKVSCAKSEETMVDFVVASLTDRLEKLAKAKAK